MGWNEIDPGTVEEAQAARDAAKAAFDANAAEIKSANEILAVAQRKNFELRTEMNNAQAVLDDQRHVAAGGCAWYVQSDWGRSSRCVRKAKNDTRYCGTHIKVKERRG
jgi:3-keto-L-gulonate-6-phosphate decarboxylase